MKYYRHLLSYRISGSPGVHTEWHFTNTNGGVLVDDLEQQEINMVSSDRNKPYAGTQEGYKAKWWRLLLTHEISEEDFTGRCINTIPINQYIFYVNPA